MLTIVLARQRSYAADYAGFVILLAGLFLVSRLLLEGTKANQTSNSDNRHNS